MFQSVLKISALLTIAFLFGGMLLFAGSFAAFLFKVLPVQEARSLIRKAFPPFYIFVIVGSALAAVLTVQSDVLSAAILSVIALTALPTRQILMPAINTAADDELKKRFLILHTASVLITLVHIVASALVLIRFAG